MSGKDASLRALVVDDEKIIADTLAMILNRNGFSAQAVYSGEDAVEAAKSLVPELLLSDIMMGELSGIDAAIQIQRTAPSCKIFLISGHSSTFDDFRAAIKNDHGFEILMKPVHPSLLLERLRTAFQAI
jgi:CheY-like chemotaxis protein